MTRLLKENTLPLWIPPTIADQPGVALTGWGVFKVCLPKIGCPTAHMVGYNERSGEGRVSSPLTKFDSKSRCGVTSSGRVYRLVGEPGLGGEASYVWDRWMSIWDSSEVRELSLEMLDEFIAASQ